MSVPHCWFQHIPLLDLDQGMACFCGSQIGSVFCVYRLPLFLFSGIEMTMWSSWFARQMYPAEIGLVMIPFGLAEFVAGTFAFGWISDKLGRWALLIPGTACMCVLQAPLFPF